MTEPDERSGEPRLIVVQQGDSFEQLWPELAAAAAAQLTVVDAAAAAGVVPGSSACLLAVPGVEEDAPELLTALRAAGAVAVAVVGAAAEHRLAVGAMRAGASEYFALPADVGALRAWVVEQAAANRARRRAVELAEEERRSYDFSQIVGESAGMREALRIASRIIPRGSATVLITGETGTGKEVLAQAIHYNGPRAAAPFVEVNCTALPANLLEAELFGYEKGAFTDARASKPGLFEAADGGSLFLDEIGDLPLDLQAKLLRVLEQKQVRRLGSVRSVSVDVRILAATHVDLEAAVREKRFREDLFFRLNVLPIHLPPLRERGDDILVLAERFLTAFAEEYDVPVRPLEESVRQALLTHEWPGNVRELRNALERAVLLGDGRIATADLFRSGAATARPGAAGEIPFPATLAEIERAAALRMVERLNGNKSAAAEILGISRTRLYRLLHPEV
ncbi:MAG TPA: sigma-54 dependent transcriptional regulator [Longimicrobiales bacterium]